MRRESTQRCTVVYVVELLISWLLWSRRGRARISVNESDMAPARNEVGDVQNLKHPRGDFT